MNLPVNRRTTPVLLLLCHLFTCIKGYGYDDNMRTWTEWINSDLPLINSGDDDETLLSIRTRGNNVCDGDIPVDAVCRVAKQPSFVFNRHTWTSLDNQLSVPCTTNGLLCRRTDQPGDRPCRDYEISFECQTRTPVQETNVAVIAVAAGLSVAVPIFCVVLMHVMRVFKDRRRARRRLAARDQTDGSENVASQTDLPPSYEQLFGENYSSTEQLFDRRNNSSSHSSNTGISNPGQNTTGDSYTSERGESSAIFSVSDGQVPAILSVHNESQQSSPPRLLRFPGMHLSIFDLISSRGSVIQSNSQVSPEVTTPPPTYSEAVEILARIPPKDSS